MLPNPESPSASPAPSPGPSLSQPENAPLVALIFDLDGTLVDSVPDLRAALNLLLAEEKRSPLSDAEVSQMVGNGVEVLIERALTATGTCPPDHDRSALVHRFLDHYRKAPAALTRPYPGVIETLTRLRDAGHPMAVCTNKPQGPAEDVLEALSLAPFFPVTLGAGALPVLKPAADPLLATLKALDHSGPAVMIGDSPNDSQAARAAGLPCVCVTFGYRRCSLEELGADRLIEQFDALPDALRSLFP